LGCIDRMLAFVKANPSATRAPGLVPGIGAS
jgi:hypothetical protein